MKKRFNFRGAEDVNLENGILYIPREIESFYDIRRRYFLSEDESGGYRYLTIFSKRELFEELLLRGHISKKLPEGFLPLEKIARKDGIKGLILPVSSLEYLSSKDDSRVKIIGIINHFEVWNPEEFMRYKSSLQVNVAIELIF